MTNFEICVAPVLKNEGGIVNNPLDPGKLTKYGISQRSYPNLDIAKLTVEQATALYKRDYWDANGMDRFPLIVAFEFFDCAVNCGSGTAARMLQQAVNVADDGHIGAITIAAMTQMLPDKIAKRMFAFRTKFYTKLSTYKTFGSGWMNRMADNALWESENV